MGVTPNRGGTIPRYILRPNHHQRQALGLEGRDIPSETILCQGLFHYINGTGVCARSSCLQPSLGEVEWMT